MHRRESLGGIIPPLASELHRRNIIKICESALNMAGMKASELHAIAVTTGPGLLLCLEIGVKFAKYLHKLTKKPVIPVHHMQAHALVARICTTVQFPYLALLASGGHCLLVIVKDPKVFYILGNTLCNAPGELFDKVARRLKLHNNEKFASMHGGQAIEYAAQNVTEVDKELLPESMLQYLDCTFSFTGITSQCIKHIQKLEEKHELRAGHQLPEVNEIAAAYQYSIVRHICQRTQRAMEFFTKMNFSGNNTPTLVLGGGVASNDYLANALAKLCNAKNFALIRPPAKYCTDNGIMVAWNGIEKLQLGMDILYTTDEVDKLEAITKLPMGEDWTAKVASERIKCSWVDTQ